MDSIYDISSALLIEVFFANFQLDVPFYTSLFLKSGLDESPSMLFEVVYS